MEFVVYYLRRWGYTRVAPDVRVATATARQLLLAFGWLLTEPLARDDTAAATAPGADFFATAHTVLLHDLRV